MPDEGLEARLKDRIERLAAMGSRVTGYPGASAAPRYLTDYLKNLGVPEIHQRRFHTPVPLDHGAVLRLAVGPDTSAYELLHMLPNLVRTSTVPFPGITGLLFYAGSGEPFEMEGSRIKGAVAVFEYDCGRRWVRAFDLGAEAVIFLAPSDPGGSHRWESSQKYLTTPADLPRFYAPAPASMALRAVLSDTSRQVPGHRAVISGSMVWHNVTGQTVVAVIPGTDPTLAHEAVVVGSYYDAISAVPAMAPGADQASGVAAWMELAAALAGQPAPAHRRSRGDGRALSSAGRNARFHRFPALLRHGGERKRRESPSCLTGSAVESPSFRSGDRMLHRPRP